MENGQIVILSVDDRKFGVSIDSVNIIEKPSRIFKVPGVPGYVEGLIDVQGKVHTVFNLRKRLGFPDRDNDEDTRIIMLEAADSPIGLLVDSVREILSVEETCIGKSPKNLKKCEKQFVKGTVNAGGRTIPILDIDALVSSAL